MLTKRAIGPLGCAPNSYGYAGRSRTPCSYASYSSSSHDPSLLDSSAYARWVATQAVGVLAAAPPGKVPQKSSRARARDREGAPTSRTYARSAAVQQVCARHSCRIPAPYCVVSLCLPTDAWGDAPCESQRVSDVCTERWRDRNPPGSAHGELCVSPRSCADVSGE
ncbi:hypothetical protein BKA93DRAFT_493342 [Sparassis latifolia]